MADVKFSAYPAPIALVEHCARRTTAPAVTGIGIGMTDPASIREMLTWMSERDAFADYDSWLSAGMICKIEAGEEGLSLWRITHDNTVTEDVETTKWNSFAADTSKIDTIDLQKIGTLFDRAKKMGCPAWPRTSAKWMFRDIPGVDLFGKPINLNPAPPRVGPTATVAQLAENVGAKLSSASDAMPLMDTQRIVASLGQPIIDNFLSGTRDAPAHPLSSDHASLPDIMSNHPLYESMQDAITRIVAMAEAGKKFRQTRVLPALAVLYAMHPTVCEHLTQRIAALGGVISPGALDSAIKNFEWRVRVETNTAAGFLLDSKGNPAPENSDNVHVFVRQRAIKLRYNTWKEQVEVSNMDRDMFVQLTDHIFGDLLMDAENSQFNYHPSEGRFRRGLVSNARRNLYDPLVERLETLAAAWDGVPRLDTWVSRTCGTSADEYHAAVGRNLIGGLVRRARHPGCEQAETVIFISPTQGTGKSTLCKILALESEWYTDSFKFGGSQQNSIPQLFGKWVVELSELAGMGQKDVEDVKQFLSSTSDNFTAKYAAFAAEHPRRCVFIGTSNSRRPLQDVSGNRRFLPVNVIGEVDTDWLRANVEQIMGECAHREAAGEVFGIPRAVWDIAGQHQESARSMSPVEELCQDWFAREGSFYIAATDIGRALKMAGQSQYARYSSFMDKMGWRNENLTIPGVGRKSRVWVHHTTNALENCVRLMPAQMHVNGPVEIRPSLYSPPATAAVRPIPPPPC